jgi:outer membrane protein TolC
MNGERCATGLAAAGSAPWFAGPTLSMPIFDRARIYARLGPAKAQQREALAGYRPTCWNCWKRNARPSSLKPPSPKA